MIAAALAFLAGAPVAHAQKIDAKGKCHDKLGHYADMSVCKGGGDKHTYKLDSKGKCRDEGGHYAKAEQCKA